MALEHTAWTYPFGESPDHIHYIEIFPERGRIVCGVIAKVDPILYVPITMDYVDVEEGLIRTRLRPDDVWVEHAYFRKGDSMVWDLDKGRDEVWTQIALDELPEWFGPLQRKGQERLDERTRLFEEANRKPDEVDDQDL